MDEKQTFYYILTTINVIPSCSTGCIKKLNGQPKALRVAPNLKPWLGRSTSFTCQPDTCTHILGTATHLSVNVCMHVCFSGQLILFLFFFGAFSLIWLFVFRASFVSGALKQKDLGILWSEWVHGGVVWSFALHLHQSWTARWMDGCMDGWLCCLTSKLAHWGGMLKLKIHTFRVLKWKITLKLQLEFLTHLGRY